MCRQQGCTAEQCGLEVSACNATTISCAREYINCSASSSDRCSCARPYVMCMSEGGCIDKTSGVERVNVHEMCIRDGCSTEHCDLLNYELELKAIPQQLTRTQSVKEALNPTCGNATCRKVELGTGHKSCQTTTLRCSRNYADCATRMADSHKWTQRLIRSSYIGSKEPYTIENDGQTIFWPAMDGSAAARPLSPLPKGKVTTTLLMLCCLEETMYLACALF